MVNDDFVVSALVLGYSIQTFSCHKTMIAPISENVHVSTEGYTKCASERRLGDSFG